MDAFGRLQSGNYGVHTCIHMYNVHVAAKFLSMLWYNIDLSCNQYYSKEMIS